MPYQLSPARAADRWTPAFAGEARKPAVMGFLPSLVAQPAILQGRAYSPHAGVSPKSDSGRNVLLYGQPAQPSFGPIGDAYHRVARRNPSGALPRSVSHRRLGCASEPHALSVDFARGRRRLRRPLARDQDHVLEICAPSESRSPVMASRGERGIWQWRYWEHTIRYDQDFAAHWDYIHFNLAPTLPSPRAQGCPGKNGDLVLPPNLAPIASFLPLSPRRPGGEGGVRGAR